MIKPEEYKGFDLSLFRKNEAFLKYTYCLVAYEPDDLKAHWKSISTNKPA